MRNLGLTPRECAAARCMLEGWSHIESARQLKVTTRTVKRFRTSVYDKTGQDTQTSLVVFLLSNLWALAQVMEVEYNVR